MYRTMHYLHKAPVSSNLVANVFVDVVLDCVKSEVRLERIELSLQRIESKLDCVIATQSGVTVENCPSVKVFVFMW